MRCSARSRRWPPTVISLRAAHCARPIWAAIRRKRCGIPVTGVTRGASADLARELGRRIGMPVEIKPLANPKAVIDAITSGEADIGFIAYAP
ncbi:MAG: transporter substrate-binding domain-containing protein, partial [Pseudolabrys sp.]|nr:transporter substrate-binding domain-containing protein [Pseudolabrys sp.]